MNGWIKLHRPLLDSSVWTSANAEGRVILITLLLSATPTPYKTLWEGKEIVVQPGQIITSIEGICALTGMLVTPQNVRTMLRKCKQAGFLTEEVAKRGRLITIANWGVYQAKSEAANKGTNEQPTNVQQTSNMLATTNREDEEEKKYKEDKEAVNACRHYQNYIGMVNGKIAEEIMMWEGLVEPELVCEAINQAARQNARWQYARAILERCKDNNILTLADYLADRKSRQPKAEKREKTAEELLRERGYI